MMIKYSSTMFTDINLKVYEEIRYHVLLQLYRTEKNVNTNRSILCITIHPYLCNSLYQLCRLLINTTGATR